MSDSANAPLSEMTVKGDTPVRVEQPAGKSHPQDPPTKFADVIGNTTNVQSLVAWLKNW